MDLSQNEPTTSTDMNTSSPALPDETVTTSSPMDIAPSTPENEPTTTESPMKHMSKHNVAVFGDSSDLSGLNLPTYLDILKYYFYLKERCADQNKMFSFTTLSAQVADKLIKIWSRIAIQLTDRKNIISRLNSFIHKYKTEIKHPKDLSNFIESNKKLFYIGKCKCDLKANRCSCHPCLIPERVAEFMHDQHNDRKLTISPFVVPVHQRLPDAPVSIASIPTVSTFEKDSVLMSSEDSIGGNDPIYTLDDIDVDLGDVELDTSTQSTPGNEYFEFASLCDRFGVSDRVASAIVTAAFKAENVRDEHGELKIVDKNKVFRERLKFRQAALRARDDKTNLIAFSFDGRKDETLTQTQIGDKKHTRTIKQAHLVILRERSIDT